MAPGNLVPIWATRLWGGQLTPTKDMEVGPSAGSLVCLALFLGLRELGTEPSAKAEGFLQDGQLAGALRALCPSVGPRGPRDQL